MDGCSGREGFSGGGWFRVPMDCGCGTLRRTWCASLLPRGPSVRHAIVPAGYGVGWSSSEPPLRVEHVTQKPLFLERQLELLFFQLCKELAHFCNTATASMQRDDGQRATASMVTFCLVARRLELRLRRLQ